MGRLCHRFRTPSGRAEGLRDYAARDRAEETAAVLIQIKGAASGSMQTRTKRGSSTEQQSMSYRFYLLDGQRHIIFADYLSASDDETAMTLARAISDRHSGWAGAELWNGTRIVVRFRACKPDEAPAPGVEPLGLDCGWSPRYAA